MSVQGQLLKIGLKPELTTRKRRVTLTADEIKAMRATPPTILPAPGARRYAEFVSATLDLTAGSVAFTESADNLAFKYTDGAGEQISEDIETTGFIDQTTNQLCLVQPKGTAATVRALAVNERIVLHNIGNGEFGAGNGTMRVTLLYRVRKRP
jgi:hypothetical protein